MGGALELHTNPWLPPADDAMRTIEPLVNRCVVFATSDHSWHGFRRIVLPPERRTQADVDELGALLTRRGRSLEYLYGRTIDYAQPTLQERVRRAGRSPWRRTQLSRAV